MTTCLAGIGANFGALPSIPSKAAKGLSGVDSDAKRDGEGDEPREPSVDLGRIWGPSSGPALKEWSGSGSTERLAAREKSSAGGSEEGAWMSAALWMHVATPMNGATRRTVEFLRTTLPLFPIPFPSSTFGGGPSAGKGCFF